MAPQLLQYHGTGRRKTSVARVFMRAGEGKFLVNGRELSHYFARKILVQDLMMPLTVVEQTGAFDIKVNVSGGGTTGQAGAIRLGLARALVRMNMKYRTPLKRAGLLTRDARKVERKKYGQPGARRRFQFSKR